MKDNRIFVARNLIEQLSALIPKVEQLNDIVNG